MQVLLEAGKNPEPCAGVIDSQFVTTTDVGGYGAANPGSNFDITFPQKGTSPDSWRVLLYGAFTTIKFAVSTSIVTDISFGFKAGPKASIDV